MLEMLRLPARWDSSEHFRFVREATDEVLPDSVSDCEANLAVMLARFGGELQIRHQAA
jgi:hypothetical protein